LSKSFCAARTSDADPVFMTAIIFSAPPLIRLPQSITHWFQLKMSY